MTTTAREVYFKVKNEEDSPMGVFYWAFEEMRNGEKLIQIFANKFICFRDDEEENIKILENIEKTWEGFLFWYASDEGEKFLKDNWSAIGGMIANKVLSQGSMADEMNRENEIMELHNNINTNKN